MRAVERDAQRTIGLVSHAAGVRHASPYGTRFTVRVWLRSKLQASIERTSSGKLVLREAATHVESQGASSVIEVAVHQADSTDIGELVELMEAFYAESSFPLDREWAAN